MNAHTLAAALPTAADQPTDAAAIHAAALLLLPHIERGERIDAAVQAVLQTLNDKVGARVRA